MRLKAIALCLMAGFCTSAFAQDSTHVLEQALKQIPQKTLSNVEAIQIAFLDTQAWRGLEKAGPSAEGMRRLVLAQPIRPLESIGYGLDTWSENAKISFDALSYFAAFGQAPSNVTYWGLQNVQASQSLIKALKGTDFTDVDGDVSGVIANGEANKLDFTKANAGNPWRGATGATSFVLPLDIVLVQASSSSDMKALAQPTPSVADSKIILAALNGLKDAVPAGNGQIVQAAIISPMFGLEGVDPAKILPSSTDDIETAKQNFKDNVEANRRGIPPYFAGFIADVQIDKAPALVISLSYADCSTAEQAVKGVVATWKETLAETVEGDVSGHTVQAGELCAGVVSVVAPKAETPANPILSNVMNRYLQRDFTLLQIGSSL
ncbi:hypothetical protein CES85_2870 (plasmid) [Ochrobactrum quorumnocens]|uniref:Uncharacterized protein n=1 Tax=Ochrobactrum quorumnocens TaxID=271865 RepID=A0A248UQ62_9HYPH|nr:hypothetical protein [[Ochrobactrum] quorumnocens]ASV88690.1 hypothetical protein CES85_2870 [[Ochrobactrum] quorumnocens]